MNNEPKSEMYSANRMNLRCYERCWAYCDSFKIVSYKNVKIFKYVLPVPVKFGTDIIACILVLDWEGIRILRARLATLEINRGYQLDHTFSQCNQSPVKTNANKNRISVHAAHICIFTYSEYGCEHHHKGIITAMPTICRTISAQSSVIGTLNNNSTHV